MKKLFKRKPKAKPRIEVIQGNIFADGKHVETLEEAIKILKENDANGR